MTYLATRTRLDVAYTFSIVTQCSAQIWNICNVVKHILCYNVGLMIFIQPLLNQSICWLLMQMQIIYKSFRITEVALEVFYFDGGLPINLSKNLSCIATIHRVKRILSLSSTSRKHYQNKTRTIQYALSNMTWFYQKLWLILVECYLF